MAATVEVIITGRDEASGPISGISNALGSLGGVALGIATAGLAAVTGGIALFVAAGIPAIATYERLALVLETLVAKEILSTGAAEDMAQALAMSEGTAAELLNWTQQLAIHSPFTQQGIADAFRMAMAYGFNVEEAKRLTQAMVDFAAGSGASEDAMGRIALALGQIEAKGKLSGQEVLQLVNAGLPVVQILAEAFNKTTAEIVEMQTAGLIPAKDAIEAITVYLETNFAGAADRQTRTWAGLLGTFQDLKAMGLREFFGELADAILPLAVSFSEWMQVEGMDKLKEWGQNLGDFAQKFIDFAAAAKDSELFVSIVDAFETFAFWLNFTNDPLDAFQRTLLTITNAGGPLAGLASMLQDAAFELSESGFTGALFELDASIADAIENIDWGALGDKFGDFIGELFSGAGSWTLPTEALSAIGDALSDFMIGAMGYISWGQLGQAFSDSLTDYFLNFFRVDAIQGAWSQIGKDITAGLAKGITFENIKGNISTFIDNVVNYFKQLLGIASPSTVFMGIGRDIVLGLIGGLGTMVGTLLTIGKAVGSLIIQGIWDGAKGLITSFFDWLGGIAALIVETLAPMLRVFGIDVSGFTSGNGGLGGHTTTPTTPIPGTSTTGSGTVVNQYFAGATINVGSWDEIAYDCIYPNPFIAATSGQLGGGGGGGTGSSGGGGR